MKIKPLLVPLFGILVIGLQPRAAAAPSKNLGPEVYNASANGAEQVKNAVAAAGKENKRILLAVWGELVRLVSPPAPPVRHQI